MQSHPGPSNDPIASAAANGSQSRRPLLCGSTSTASDARRRRRPEEFRVGILTGPGYWNLDLGIGKNLYIDDKRYFTFKVGAFNVFNHPNFALNNLSTNFDDPTSLGELSI